MLCFFQMHEKILHDFMISDQGVNTKLNHLE